MKPYRGPRQLGDVYKQGEGCKTHEECTTYKDSLCSPTENLCVKPCPSGEFSREEELSQIKRSTCIWS
ncbi:hypothetical protein OESDEN_11502 [Oesophagostomum dentatum]|uniref:Uncharacterized protein n=1 Tax=Oesophagostomum dentatum TaxID=61180 RepID=A0A0B1SYY3_OESDE|nr:hypothetical protein OESDEN_11502 [Oesophagostomum dentatum]